MAPLINRLDQAQPVGIGRSGSSEIGMRSNHELHRRLPGWWSPSDAPTRASLKWISKPHSYPAPHFWKGLSQIGGAIVKIRDKFRIIFDRYEPGFVRTSVVRLMGAFSCSATTNQNKEFAWHFG